MQKKYTLFLILLTIWGCNQSNAIQRTAAANEDFALQYENELDTAWNETAQTRFSTAVPLPPGRTPLQVYNRQLTDRAAEEQIVIARHPELGNLELFLISGRVVSSVEGSVADYRIVAKQELQIDSETFALQTQDLTGDGVTQEIFISGQDTQSGLEHVYVFMLLGRGADENIAGLRRIFTQQGEGSYEVSYDGRRYYIVYQRLLDADSGQLEISQLYWSRASRAFIVQDTKRIDSNIDLPANLKAAYQGSAQDFFMAIDGLWMQTAPSSEVSSQEQNSNNLFVHFDAPARELAIYGDLIGLGENQQVIEIYDISGIAKSLWNRINLNIRNKYVYNIQNSFYITLQDWNTMQLFLMEGANYAGTYQRIDRENFRSYRDEKVVGPSQFMLEGVFRERGRIYTFQPDKLRIDEQPDESGGQIWEGAYSLYSWNGSNYLEFHVTETQNFTEYRRSYRVEPVDSQNRESDQTETEEEAAAPSVVVLHPVRLLQGEEVADTSQSIIRLEREQVPEISLNTEPDEGSILETTK